MWSNISASRGLRARPVGIGETCESGGELSASSLNRELDGDKFHDKNSDDGSPLMRYKHAVCSSPNGYIYIHGGRFGNLPLDDDVWRFDPSQNSWLQLKTHGFKPPNLQEHTIVEYNDRLYLFGGQVSASNTENSFWQLDLASNEWRSLSLKSSKFGAHFGPTNRRGHSAIIYANSMYIFGGFEDFRGSSAQLWEYDLIQQRWELKNLSSTSACHPEARHSHSAIVYNDSMYVYGGLSNLKPLSDLWRWGWREKRWFREKTRGASPGQLHGHTAIQAYGSMFVFGGERNGRASRSLWRLNLSNMTWRKVKAKGPRPSPTTWHGAIANPLNILDATNYIIEGDHDLVGNSSSNDECYTECKVRSDMSLRFAPQTRHLKQADQKLKQLLSHSQSSDADLALGGSLFAQAQQDQSGRRKSRLSFLRKYRRERPVSTYELKTITTSSSSSDFNRNRHSISNPPTNKTVSKHVIQRQNLDDKSKQGKLDNQLNSNILDNLDTDIKRMFQSALGPELAESSQDFSAQASEEPMSVDCVPSQVDQSLLTSKSRYITAIPADSLSGLATIQSQRSSYAYNTPPSELASSKDQQQHDMDRLRSHATVASKVPLASGYNRRDNRPKSEIVQSLIDRADAQIKHLYTPHFNQADTNKGTRKGPTNDTKLRIRAGDGHSKDLDKSKRHTIHQTMTYYNLYFSEDKSSTSSDSNQASQMNSERQNATKTNHNSLMVRDDLSSTTIRGVERSAANSGTLVGIHEISQADQHSQSSLDVNSSDSKTICGENYNNVQADSSSSFGHDNLPSSIGNALTARRETGESCDNTSLSFSVIAEFEEDDMLQYSSPTDPVLKQDFMQYSSMMDSNLDPPIELKSPSIKPSESCNLGAGERHLARPVLVDQRQGAREDHLTHKSASSGYDSISGCEQSSKSGHGESKSQSDKSPTGHGYGTGTSDTHEDSSIRTDPSSGFTTTNTSPEQSVSKRMKCKQVQRRTDSDDVPPENPIVTAIDSTYSSQDTCPTPTDTSLASTSTDLLSTSRKVPIISRSKFFCKHKSKTRYWQLCMFVIGGKQGGVHGTNQPITIWRLYI